PPPRIHPPSLHDALPISAAANGHVTIVCEQEHRPVVFLAQPPRFLNIVHPGDVVKLALVLGGLPILNALGHPGGELGVGFLFASDRKSTRLNSSHVSISY